MLWKTYNRLTSEAYILNILSSISPMLNSIKHRTTTIKHLLQLNIILYPLIDYKNILTSLIQKILSIIACLSTLLRKQLPSVT
uniref:Uncharacterized protein n=1 Tax=Arsenophonus nasoniae TaxID=638 RepID=D2TVT1_9GAMM|nr:hypothetical protein ARN_01270 [Arsenophonus nasoniae]